MPVVELGQIVDALALAVEVQKKHRVGHGQEITVEHDIREDPLHNNAEHSHRQDLDQNPPHGSAGILSVSNEADHNQDHLADGDGVADGIEGTTLVYPRLIKVKQTARPNICTDKPQIDHKENGQSPLGIGHAVIVVGVFQDLGKQIQRNGRGGHDVDHKVKAVNRHVQPQRNP